MTSRLSKAVGGSERLRVIVLLAAVLGINSADLGAVGAVAPQLQAAFGISHTQLGLLAAVSSAIGALASVPMGVLADRAKRVRLLVVTILVWSVALSAGGAAPSYAWLLFSRLALGGASAAAGPVLASLTGDLFPPAERARIYGWVLSGEIIGAGIGLLAGANIAAMFSWRLAFWLLAAAGLVLAFLVRRHLPEPPRTQAGTGRQHTLRGRLSELRAGFAYVIRTPTIRMLVIASAVGYFFLAGLRTFAVVFAERQYHISAAGVTALALVVGAGALLGVSTGGRISDVLLDGRVRAVRVAVPAYAYVLAAVLFVPALLVTSAWMAAPLAAFAAAALAAANPPLDAARLDLAPPDLWGRAESARTVLRLAAEALAPLTFGALADALAGPGASVRADAGTGPGDASGLQWAFLIMLAPLVANGIILLGARRTFDADARAAQAGGRS